jgi:hypothetical protein
MHVDTIRLAGFQTPISALASNRKAVFHHMEFLRIATTYCLPLFTFESKIKLTICNWLYKMRCRCRARDDVVAELASELGYCPVAEHHSDLFFYRYQGLGIEHCLV